MNKGCIFINLSSGDVVVILMKLQVENVKVRVVVVMTIVMVLLLDVLDLPILDFRRHTFPHIMEVGP